MNARVKDISDRQMLLHRLWNWQERHVVLRPPAKTLKAESTTTLRGYPRARYWLPSIHLSIDVLFLLRHSARHSGISLSLDLILKIHCRPELSRTVYDIRLGPVASTVSNQHQLSAQCCRTATRITRRYANVRVTDAAGRPRPPEQMKHEVVQNNMVI